MASCRRATLWRLTSGRLMHTSARVSCTDHTDLTVHAVVYFILDFDLFIFLMLYLFICKSFYCYYISK